MTAMPEGTPVWDLRDELIPPTSARALARALILNERARAAAARRRRGFGLRAPASMPDGALRRRRVFVA